MQGAPVHGACAEAESEAWPAAEWAAEWAARMAGAPLITTMTLAGAAASESAASR